MARSAPSDENDSPGPDVWLPSESFHRYRALQGRIRRGVTWVDGHPVVGPPKTAAGFRDGPIPPHLLLIVEDHLARRTGPGLDALYPAQGGQM
jgi:hypothetical protein